MHSVIKRHRAQSVTCAHKRNLKGITMAIIIIIIIIISIIKKLSFATLKLRWRKIFNQVLKVKAAPKNFY